jgi:hypothetical protein
MLDVIAGTLDPSDGGNGDLEASIAILMMLALDAGGKS